MAIGYKIFGRGEQRLVLLHDWFADCSGYDHILPYMSMEKYSLCFIDLRGYGRSKDILGKYNLEEAIEDISEVAKELNWDKFHLIGHSMTTLIGQKFIAQYPEKILSFIAICPVPASGLNMPPEAVEGGIKACEGDKDIAKSFVHYLTSGKYSDSFINYKVRKWYECSVPKARINYMRMFNDTNITSEVKGSNCRVRVICAEFDGEAHRLENMVEAFGTNFSNCEVIEIKNSGHYPMQETPINLVTLIDQLLDK